MQENGHTDSKGHILSNILLNVYNNIIIIIKPLFKEGSTK